VSRLELQVLGCGDALGSGGRLHTCFSLASEGRRLLVDCGATAMIGMRRFDVAPSEVDAIVLTHLHGDHFAGIPYFLLVARHLEKRREPLVIAGPPGTEERVDTLMEAMYPGSTEHENGFDLRYVELRAGEPCDVAFAKVTATEVVHPSGAPAYALRVAAAGRTFAYTGDTEWVEALVDVARGADLFLCECSDYRPFAPYHMNYGNLLRRRADFECGRLMLTHLGVEMIARLAEIEVECLEDGQRVIV
jgi:ribonuclease BN (tRNA processing enzyme)